MTQRRRLRVLLVKPYQPATTLLCQPPLGILYLIASLRRHFGDQIEVGFRDMRLFREAPEKVAAEIAGRYDLVGISAINCEAEGAHALSRAVRELSPKTIIALGGPYARSAPDRAMSMGEFDWLFGGEADRTFPQAVERRFFGDGDLSSVPGLTWRDDPRGPFVANGGEDSIPDLNALPMPAWDLVPFDLYAVRHNMNGTLRAKRYAPLFTSRGCPYLCHYCHDLFGKGFRWRSPENVLEEIDLLTSRYGVREFQIIDDIYNLHKPRMRAIARKVIEGYGRRSLFFTFPNGVRGDIIDPADLPLLRDMGVYDMTIAIETVSPRLQKLIDKNLDVERARRAIDAAVDAGISVKGFFMIGFPTETREEIERTVRFAQESRLTIAYFFFVIPQQGTPLHALAKQVSPRALELVSLHDYYAKQSWYELAYDVDMTRIRRDALLRFYLRPARILRLVRRTNLQQLRLLGEASSFKAIFRTGRDAPSPGSEEPAGAVEARRP